MSRSPVLTPLAGALALALSLPAAADPALAATDLDTVHVHGHHQGYKADTTRTATKTDTLLRDVPQAVTVVTEEQMRDQGTTGLMDVVRYVPGVGIAQGEGNRDTAVFRGNSSTADFFVDGIRDDVQYIRDTYNIERVEALKGPNAMIFGRGGSGGVLNRVTKQADRQTHREVGLQLGSWDRTRGTVDLGQPLGDSAAFRVTAMYEDSATHRDGADLQRYGINPTFTVELGEATRLELGYEHFRDDRVADRGVSSLNGRPLDTEPGTFFGDPERSPVWARVNAFNALFEHDFGNGLLLRNRTRFADYAKFYQNVFPGAVSGGNVSIAAYSNLTNRDNLFNQTDLTWVIESGAMKHTLLAGAEYGRQESDNFRQTGVFPANASCGGARPVTNAFCVPLSNPRYTGPLTFAQSATDADNDGVAKVAAVYVQDQIEFSPQWQAVLGLRYDRFEVDIRNNRNGATFSSTDDLVSPRVGLVYKPVEPVSIYASYSLAYLPRAGEQLASLSLTNQVLDPEEFRNYEIGAKWDLRDDLALTAAVYRLDRKNVAITNPAYDPVANPNVPQSLLVDGQYSEGVEVGLGGELTDAWSVMGGYAYQRGEITSTPARTDLAQLPRHTFSLWNRFDLGKTWGVGLGVIHRDSMFAAADNRVTLPGFTRVDAAVYYTASEHLKLQLNIENLLDEDYYASAHSNTNITPGAPRSVYLGLNFAF